MKELLESLREKRAIKKILMDLQESIEMLRRLPPFHRMPLAINDKDDYMDKFRDVVTDTIQKLETQLIEEINRCLARCIAEKLIDSMEEEEKQK